MAIDFELTEEQALLRAEVRRFAEEQIAPGVADRDRDHSFPHEVIADLGRMGLLGALIEPEFGGSGLDPLTYCLVIEELARICPATAVTVSVTNSVCAWPISRFGSLALKQIVLPDLANGALGGFCLTEPGSGSDAANLQTRAERNGADWILRGEKAWITNAGVARWYVVLARSDQTAGKRGITAFVVRADWDGVRIGSNEDKLGLRASRTATVYLDDVQVPDSFRLGEMGQGFKIALATLDHSRLGIAAQAVGIHQRALELAVNYARTRVQFGVPIAEHQAIRFVIAQRGTELEAARCLTYQAALASERDPEAGRWASEAKAFASEAANRACFDALQIHGGNGFSAESEISRLYRDVRVTTIYEGTSEMQRLVIARHLLGRS